MTPTSPRLNVFVIDSQPLWMEAVSAVSQRIGCRVVGFASPESAWEAPSLGSADVVVVDPPRNAAAFVRELRVRVQNARIIVLSAASPSEGALGKIFEAGAAAFVTKSAHPDDLAAVLRTALGDSFVLISRDALTTKPRSNETTAPSAGEVRTALTRREREILELVAEGHSNAGLAKRLWVTEQTIKFHLSNIYRKLDVANRTEAARWAELNGVLETDVSDAGSSAA